MLANLWSPKIINRYGSRNSLLFAYSVYSVYCFGLLSKLPSLIYGLSILIGAAAGLLWTAQNSYLVRASRDAEYGKSAGFFGTCFAIGAGLGVLAMGLLIPLAGQELSFGIFAGVILLGGFCFWQLGDVRSQQIHNGNLRKILRSKTATRYSMLWLAFNFIQGLVVGIIPLKISDIIGISAVGPLIGIFFVSPILFSYFVGKKSDITGRRIWVLLMLASSLSGLVIMAIADTTLLLIVGLFILALNFGISRTITLALVGDIATDKNVESLSALVWIVQAGATLLALILSALLINSKWIYIIGLAIAIFSILIALPLTAQPLAIIRRRIAQETR